MSHRVVYGQLAVRFDKGLLRTASGGGLFHQDQSMLLELGGDNNMTTYNPATGREVGARRWSVLAYGCHTEVMRAAIRLSANCEDGDMRIYGERYTKPEAYIRKVRALLNEPLRPAQLQQLGFSIKATLSCSPESELYQRNAESIAAMAEALQLDPLAGEWSLDPLASPLHTALLIKMSHIDTSSPWNICDVQGPLWDWEELVRAVQTRSAQQAVGGAE